MLIIIIEHLYIFGLICQSSGEVDYSDKIKYMQVPVILSTP